MNRLRRLLGLRVPYTRVIAFRMDLPVLVLLAFSEFFIIRLFFNV
jgi:hypothetical protein